MFQARILVTLDCYCENYQRTISFGSLGVFSFFFLFFWPLVGVAGSGVPYPSSSGSTSCSVDNIDASAVVSASASYFESDIRSFSSRITHRKELSATYSKKKIMYWKFDGTTIRVQMQLFPCVLVFGNFSSLVGSYQIK